MAIKSSVTPSIEKKVIAIIGHEPKMMYQEVKAYSVVEITYINKHDNLTRLTYKNDELVALETQHLDIYIIEQFKHLYK